MNSRLSSLNRYPFERLRALLADTTPAAVAPISLGVGEPKHPAPALFLETLAKHGDGFANYPATGGLAILKEASARWLERRFGLPQVDAARQIIPCSGTREALFSIAQAVVNPGGVVLMPNPFYQIYDGASQWAGAEAICVAATEANGYLPDYASLPAEVLDKTELLYLCSPGNPTGRVAPLDYLTELIALADRHDFVIAADECYSEIYPDETTPPAGLLEACARIGRDDYRRCLVFHSLSKRSNLPGARCGFVAGDAEILSAYLHLRTYTGCAIPPPIQHAAAAVWADETHVVANRNAYRASFEAVNRVLSPVTSVPLPDAGFYLWLPVPGGGETFAQRLYERSNVVVLPGAYLARTVDGQNPGDPYVRMALVDTPERCAEAARRMAPLL